MTVAPGLCTMLVRWWRYYNDIAFTRNGSVAVLFEKDNYNTVALAWCRCRSVHEVDNCCGTRRVWFVRSEQVPNFLDLFCQLDKVLLPT